MKGSKEAPISLDSDEDDWPVQYELGSDGELVEVTHRPRSSEKSTGRSQQQQQHQNQQQPPPNSVEHRLADQKPGLKHSTATTWNTSSTSIKTDGHPVPPANLEQTPTFTQKLRMPRVVQGDGQHLGVVAPQQNRSASLPSENIEVTKCPAPPIGTRAGPQCEQTTFQRVEIAKPCPRRVTTDEEAFGSKTVRKPFNKVRKSTGSNLAKKSALSDPRRRKTTFQSTKRTARFPEAGNRPESSGRSSSTDTEDSFPVQNPPGLSKSAVVVDASSTTRTPTTVCSTTGAYGSANKKQNVMGAHVSTSAHSPSAVASHQQRISPKLHAHSMSVTGADHIPKIDSIASNMRDANQAALEIVETAIHLHDPESLSNPLSIDTMDVVKARLEVEASLKRHLVDRYEDHAYLTRNTMWRQRTCLERDACAKPYSGTNLPERYIQKKSPFKNMTSIDVPYEKGRPKEQMRDISQEIFIKISSKETITKSTWSIPVTTHKTDAALIPPFKEYVSLKMNVLADNEAKLITMPYLGEEHSQGAQDRLRRRLPQNYEIRHDLNALLDLRNEQCRFYYDSMESFLTDIDISWETVLFFLLAPDEKIRLINRNLVAGCHGFESLLLNRSAYEQEKFRRDEEMRTADVFDRDTKHWANFLYQTRIPSAPKLRLAGLACAAILSECGLSPWYMASKSKIMQDYVQTKLRSVEHVSNMAFKTIVCRVCHLHNCPFHGEIREHPDSETERESNQSDNNSEENSEDERGTDEDDHVHRKTTRRLSHNYVDEDLTSDTEVILPAHADGVDSDVEKVINYKIPINPDALPPKPYSESTRRLRPPNGPFNAKWWLQHTGTKNWETRRPFIPCNHEGSCIDARCRCYRDGVTCEKTCTCPSSCNRRFPGCNCTPTLDTEKRVCGNEKQCLCVKFDRECDADICGGCGATEILDPSNRYNEDITQGRCSNVAIQRGLPKKTLLGQSEVHGFGLYAGQDIKKDDMIGEYTGEIISTEESERRMVIYEYDNSMYLFKLNQQQDVDATWMGNKLRFINNANPKLTNCKPKVLLCNTVFRVALYATVDIRAGTELFFHYNYPEDVTKDFKQPKPKSNLVVVKQKTKATAVKTVAKTKPFDPDFDRKRREACEKARAVKAAKHAALLAEKGNNQGASSLKHQARKSVSNISRLANSSPMLEVQETDEEDEFMADSLEKAESDTSEVVTDVTSDDEPLPRQPNKLNRAVKSAVRDRGSRLRSKADGKRKRAGTINSDED